MSRAPHAVARPALSRLCHTPVTLHVSIPSQPFSLASLPVLLPFSNIDKTPIDRPMFNPGSQFTHDAQSPPLHHPVPQHPLPRSPPNFNDAIPAQAQAANPNPYAPATAYTGPSAQQQQQQQQTQDPPQAFGHHAFGAATALNSIGSTQQQTQPNAGFSGFQQYLNDPSAQIGLSVGRNALNYGQEYIGKNVSVSSA